MIRTEIPLGVSSINSIDGDLATCLDLPTGFPFSPPPIASSPSPDLDCSRGGGRDHRGSCGVGRRSASTGRTEVSMIACKGTRGEEMDGGGRWMMMKRMNRR